MLCPHLSAKRYRKQKRKDLRHNHKEETKADLEAVKSHMHSPGSVLKKGVFLSAFKDV